MSKFAPWIFLSLFSCLAASLGVVRAADPATHAAKLRVLVVSGGHPFPVKPFQAVFAGFSDMQCTFVEEKQTAEAFDDTAHFPYDAILLYNYMRKPTDKQWANFTGLLDRGVGLVILHHAIYGYRPRPEFQKIVGVTSWLTGAKNDFDIRVHVADPQHPIAKGLKDFTIRDEVYQGAKLDPQAHVILTTDQPANEKAVAWVHTYRKSPVCYLQLGHDQKAYNQPEFPALLHRAVLWTAGRLKP